MFLFYITGRNMLSIEQFINERLSRADINQVEKYADRLFKELDIDIDLSGNHFYERVNDARNGKNITQEELIELFKRTFIRQGKKIASKSSGFESVIRDINSDIHLPFMLKYDAKNNELDLIAKTVMRKKDFKAPSIIKVY